MQRVWWRWHMQADWRAAASGQAPTKQWHKCGGRRRQDRAGGSGPGQAPSKQWHKCHSAVGAGRAGTLVLDDLLGQTRVAFTTDDDGAGVARPGYIKREPTSAPAAAAAGRRRQDRHAGARRPVRSNLCGIRNRRRRPGGAGVARPDAIKREELPRNGPGGAGGGGRSSGDERGSEEAEGRV